MKYSTYSVWLRTYSSGILERFIPRPLSSRLLAEFSLRPILIAVQSEGSRAHAQHHNQIAVNLQRKSHWNCPRNRRKKIASKMGCIKRKLVDYVGVITIHDWKDRLHAVWRTVNIPSRSLVSSPVERWPVLHSSFQQQSSVLGADWTKHCPVHSVSDIKSEMNEWVKEKVIFQLWNNWVPQSNIFILC